MFLQERSRNTANPTMEFRSESEDWSRARSSNTETCFVTKGKRLSPDQTTTTTNKAPELFNIIAKRFRLRRD